MSEPVDYENAALGGDPPADGRPPRGVVAVLVLERRYLLVKRAEQVSAAGWWCFPGGTLDPGESETEALARELEEELGVAVEPVQHLWRAVTAWGVDLSWWQVRFAPGADPEQLNPAADEIAEVRWLDREELLAMPRLLGSNRAFFEYRRDRLLLP